MTNSSCTNNMNNYSNKQYAVADLEICKECSHKVDMYVCECICKAHSPSMRAYMF